MRHSATSTPISCRILILLSCLVLLAATSPDERPITDAKSIVSVAKPQAGAAPIPQLYYTRSTYGPAWSPDGREVVFTTNLTGRFNLWKVSASGGWPIQLLQSDDRQSGAVWSPDGKWIVFEQDFGGGEIYDLFAVSSDGTQTINITNTPEVSENGAHWSPDGESLAISYRPKNSSKTDIALLDWKTRDVRKLTNEETINRGWSGAIWSPDGKAIYADRESAGGTDSDIYRIDVATGRQENLTPHQGEVIFHVSSISPDRQSLLISSNEKGGYQNVALLDIATKKRTWVTDLKWEATAGDFAPNGKSYVYSVNADGRTDIYSVDRGRPAEKLPFPDGINTPVAIRTRFRLLATACWFRTRARPNPRTFMCTTPVPTHPKD
jgi:Tol biopolymer transport system component